MWNEADPTFEWASVALQVTTCGPSEKSVPDAGLQPTSASGPSRLSVAVGVPKVTIDPAGPFASTKRSDETPVKAGAVTSMSVSVTENEASCLLPCVSVAEQVTGVVPSGKVDPDAGSHETDTAPSRLSFAVGSANVTALPLGDSVVTLIAPGTLFSTGFVWSTSVTTTSNPADALLWCWSVAVQVTCVVPTEKRTPELGVQPTGVKPSTLSIADGLVGKETCAPVGSSVSCATPEGTPLSTGAVVSTSVRLTLKVVWLLLLWPSSVVHVTVVVPSAKWDIDAGSHTTSADCPRSVAVGRS